MSYSIVAIVWLCFIVTVAVSIPHLDILEAKSLEEFQRAADGYRRSADLDPVPPARDLGDMADSTILTAKDKVCGNIPGIAGFYHGVGSGSPSHDSINFWTRYTPLRVSDTVKLELRVAKIDSKVSMENLLNPKKNRDIIKLGVKVDSSTDFIAKIRIAGLEPNTKYVYGFTDGVVSTMVGKTGTTPLPGEEVESMTYAFFSCSHFSNGYFHAYDVASTIEGLDLWIHVGDYVYEYGAYGTYATDVPERNAQTDPAWEQISLNDHRRRFAQYHCDEGLQNLRAAAPMIAVWDDHETTNNSYGQGTPETTGAENHQEFCTCDPHCSDEDKSDAQCDRDEGDIVERLNNAAQAYMEWMPMSNNPDSNMGVIEGYDFAQVLQWGNLATFVTFDTRISYRSEFPTLNSFFGPFYGPATVHTDVENYGDLSTAAGAAFRATALAMNETIFDEAYTQIGEYINYLSEEFEKSVVEYDTTWQVGVLSTVLSPQIPPNFLFCGEASGVDDLQTYCDGVLQASLFFRAATAMAITQSPWNSDGFAGFGQDRIKISEIARDIASNPVFLGGDVHDFWANVIYEDGSPGPGTPVAVNLVAGGVTSPGWGPFLSGAFLGSPVERVIGTDATWNMMAELFSKSNEGNKYGNIRDKGFAAVKLTQTEQTVEFFHISAEDLVSDFPVARAASEAATADYYCGGSLITTAGVKGSLETQYECSTISIANKNSHDYKSIVMPSSSFTNRFPLSGCGATQCEWCDFGACTTNASCVDGVCVCDDGYEGDPSVTIIEAKYVPYFACVDINECLTGDNICAPATEGGVCVDYDPPIKYQCFCDAGYVPIEMNDEFGATSCEAA